MARILVTGAGGFIGRALTPALVRRGHQVVAALRRVPPPGLGADPDVEYRVLGDLGAGGEWSGALHGAEVVIHLAQRAHQPPSREILSDEAALAAGLARDARRAGVRRFIYLSSVKAMADVTPPGRALRADDPPQPEDAYGRAKLACESTLREVAAATGLELAIIRPPLVYGPGVAANFRALVRLAASGLPLPFAAVDNRRSLVFIDNLVDLIATSATHPAAPGHVFLVSDGRDFSTPELVTILARAQGRPARLFPVPPQALAGLCPLPCIGPIISRLTLSLRIDDGPTRAALGWTPPVSAERGLTVTAQSA